MSDVQKVKPKKAFVVAGMCLVDSLLGVSASATAGSFDDLCLLCDFRSVY